MNLSMIVFSLFRKYGDEALDNANYLKVDNRHGRRRFDAVAIAGMWFVVSVEWQRRAKFAMDWTL